jgi:hypothetical protein
MTFPVVLLWITGALFAGFGVGFAAVPNELAELVTGGAPATPSAATDMRATYGGVSLGLALFFGLCAARPQWVRPGLVAALLVVGSLGATRLVGIVADGEPNGFMLLFLASEIAAVGLTAVALRSVGSAPRGSS